MVNKIAWPAGLMRQEALTLVRAFLTSIGSTFRPRVHMWQSPSLERTKNHERLRHTYAYVLEALDLGRLLVLPVSDDV